MAAKRFRLPSGPTGPRRSRRGLQNLPARQQAETRKALRVAAGNGHGKPLGLQPKRRRTRKPVSVSADTPLKFPVYAVSGAKYRLRVVVAPRDPDDACYRAERERAERHLGRPVGSSR